MFGLEVGGREAPAVVSPCSVCSTPQRQLMLNSIFLFIPFTLQTFCMAVDEFYFHRRRGLPRWERLGHPLDTLTALACFVWLLSAAPSALSLSVYVCLSVFSCLFVTKDEPVHSKHCSPNEQWLHALLFSLHPLVLLSAGLLELHMAAGDITKTGRVNNDIYDHLGERWYTARDDPIALLRAEARARNPWIAGATRQAFPSEEVKVLDIGCGGGFLSNYLVEAGFTVIGLDAAAESLMIARRHDATGRACYHLGDAYRLPYAGGAFQAACAMDFLEHVDEPGRVLAEAARVLQPGGLFFFATFNRNFISWLFGIKGVEWFVKNTTPRLHELSHFIKPTELRAMCEESGLRVKIGR